MKERFHAGVTVVEAGEMRQDEPPQKTPLGQGIEVIILILMCLHGIVFDRDGAVCSSSIG